ncbi:MAG: hypothetical protein QGH66_06825 [Dehalococcoidia bacterium]|jgi:acetyl-CoA decarbonylase/synthase complex subunit alpha|nr:hypothetical protein [Dehalococcoidia bacterium]
MADRLVNLGGSQVNISKVARDPRGVEDLLAEAIGEDWQENRFLQFDERLFPYADALDMAEWDGFLLERYPPLYPSLQRECTDCPLGPCSLGVGRCGLGLDTYQARLSLRRACRGCVTQIADSRELVDYALRNFGPDHPISMGQQQDRSDYTAIGVLTGQHVSCLGELNIALSYAEGQMAKLFASSYTVTTGAAALEGTVFHAGSLLMLAQDAAEFVKMSCLGFTNAADKNLEDLIEYPTATTQAGMGGLEAGKPVIAFVGDSVLAAHETVGLLLHQGLAEKVEVGGVGPAGHDIIRFYEQGRLLAPMTQAAKFLHTGLADVVVASNGCLTLDLVGETARTGSRLIWVSPQPLGDLPDRTDDPAEDTAADLLNGAQGAVIRLPQKAAEVAVKVATGLKREGTHLPGEAAIKNEAGRCRDDCDACFRECPNSLPIGTALRSIAGGEPDAFNRVEEGCFFCHRCQEVCPENIPLLDIIAATLKRRAPQDRFIIRAGRGPTSRSESSSYAFGSMWGNCPGKAYIAGCGDAKYLGDLSWIARELVSRNCLVWVAGCAAAEVGRYYDSEEDKHLYQLYTAEAQPRNLMNCGGCTAHAHMLDESQKYSRTGSAISHYANLSETAERMYNLFPQALIIWGALPERMYTIAAAFARVGVPVIVGPSSAFSWDRYLVANKWDWQHWFVHETWGGRKRFIEPTPKHLIVPVETKEEAVTLFSTMTMRATDLRDSRQIRLETYTEFNEKFFGGFPDDIQFYISSDWELPLRYKGKLLKYLADSKGWETQRMKILKARHPDGRMLTLDELAKDYSARTMHVTYIPRLISQVPEGGEVNK